MKHIHLVWNTDFAKSVIEGKTILSIQAHGTLDTIIFDTKDLNVTSVSINGKPSNFSLNDPVAIFGSALVVTPSQAFSCNDDLEVIFLQSYFLLQIFTCPDSCAFIERFQGHR